MSDNGLTRTYIYRRLEELGMLGTDDPKEIREHPPGCEWVPAVHTASGCKFGYWRRKNYEATYRPSLWKL